MQNHLEPSGLDNIIVRPVYLRAVNAIVHPEIQAPCSLYFLQNWLPRLGALRWSLVLALRSICTQRQPDGTNRGEFTRTDLARMLGVHEATISRLLNTTPSTIHPGWRVLQPVANDDDETIWLAKFVPRLRYKYERDPVAAVTRRVGYVVDVVIDDPLVPDDEERLAVLLAEQLLQGGPGPGTVMTPDAPRPSRRTRSTPDTRSSSPATPDQPSAHNTVRHSVKTQNTFGTVSVNTQNASATPSIDAQLASSRSSVRERKASHRATSMQDAPTLTLTNNYIYREICIDLRLTRKRDIRSAITPLVNLAADALNDHHSTGMFFSALTQLYPSHLGVFTEALEIAEQEGQLSADLNMGAVFVNAIKQLAAEAGAELSFGRQRAEASSANASRYSRDAGEDSFDNESADDQDQGSNDDNSEESPKLLEMVLSGAGPSVAAKQLWPSVLQELQAHTSRTNYEMWLRNCEILGFDGDVVVIGAPSAFARDWIDQRLLETIRSALRRVVAKEVRVRCEVTQHAGLATARTGLRRKE